MNRGTMKNAHASRQPNHSRRRFLRGVGAAIALPAFESFFRGGTAFGAEAAVNAAGAPVATTASGAPLRMAFVYVPNGAIQPNWWPTGDEQSYQLAKTMQPLEKMRQ